MTSTLGVWILTVYGAAKAPRLMQFSVHCDHLRSVLFVRAGPSPYGEMVAALTTLFRKKMCASIYVHGRGRNFYPVNREFDGKASLNPSEMAETQFYKDELLKYFSHENKKTKLFVYAKDTEGAEYTRKAGTVGKLIDNLSK